MGWNTGSEIFDIIIKAVQKHVPDKEIRKEIYKPIYESFCWQDWDTQNEVLGIDPAYDELHHEMEPEYYEEENEE